MYGMIFTRVIRRLIYLLIIVSWVSCSPYRTLQVEVLQPAKFQIEYHKGIALLNRNIHWKNSPIVYVDKKSEAEVSREFINGVNYVFSDMYLDTITQIPEQKRSVISLSEYPSFLSKDTVQLLCQEFNVNHIIVIELQSYEYRRHLVNCRWIVRLYENGKDNPSDTAVINKLLPETDYRDTDMLLEDLKAAFWDGGAEYAQRLVPYWKQTERRVYHQGKILGMGAIFFQKENIEDAIKIWESACQLSPKTAIKAKINLAWIYENSGDFEKALVCLQEAKQLAQENEIQNSTTAYLQQYIQLLNQRIQYRDFLDEQMKYIEN